MISSDLLFKLVSGEGEGKRKSCARYAFVSTTFKLKKRRANVLNNVSILLIVKSPGSPGIKSLTSITEFELLNQESVKSQGSRTNIILLVTTGKRMQKLSCLSMTLPRDLITSLSLKSVQK